MKRRIEPKEIMRTKRGLGGPERANDRRRGGQGVRERGREGESGRN